MFQPPRNRDASATIRGYVFQVDQTIERWLHLGEHQILELERGEDIDVVSKAIVADGLSGPETRLLEQIKCREQNLTLRTEAAIEALANFHDHLRHNPLEDLRFCFLTNATVGCERLNPFPNRTPGITLWEQIRTAKLSDKEIAPLVGQLRQFLVNLSKPDILPDEVWTAWSSFLTTVSVEEFRAFIDRFEWSTNQSEAVAMPLVLCNTLLTLGFTRDRGEAAAINDRLFVYIMRLLSTSGIKRLTASERSRVLATLTLTESERAVLALLRQVVTEHTDRLDQLEANVDLLGNRVETLFFASTQERVALAVPAPDFSLPTPVVHLCSRRETTATLCRMFANPHWLALNGGPDTGKTQLALQIVRAYGCCSGWVRFHYSQSTVEARGLLEANLVAIAGWARIPQQANWFGDAFTALDAGTLIVFDDLPRIPSDDPFAELLVRVGQAAMKAGIRLVSTSQYELPVRLRHSLDQRNLTDRPIPPFTDAEAGDLLRSYGASDAILTEQRLGFLNGFASGHPLLLAATAEFLANRNWQYREDEIDALLRGDHTRPLLPEVIDRLVRTLDEAPKEFLYRLSLPFGSFDQDDMVAVASVTPIVERRGECLNNLLGAWVQRDTSSRYMVSPLVKSLGRSELHPDVRKQCFYRLAEVITSRGEMDPFECERAILYNLEAGEHDRAITLYVLFLVESLRTQRVEHPIRLIDKWRTTDLPAELSVGNRLFVRAYQLAAFTKHKLDTQFLVRDIDKLLAQATDRDGWAILALAVQNLRWFSRKDPSRLIRYIQRALELPSIYGPDGREIVFDTISIPNLLWMVITDLRTPDLLRRWFDAVESIPERQRTEFWQSDIGRQGVWILPNKVYMIEWERPQKQQDWNKLLGALESLLTRAQRMQQPHLEAAIAGKMLEILGDNKRADETPQVAEPILTRWPSDPDVQFKIRGIWGRQYAFNGQPERALSLLDGALAQPHSLDDFERLRSLLAASKCVSEQNLHYAELARDLAKSSATAPAIEAARALGEYAISRFHTQGGQAGAIAIFPAWSETMRRFFSVPRKDRVWRDLFPLFAHATSYLFYVARYGVPPEQTIEGDVFVVPKRGFLLKDCMPEREALYSESGHASVAFILQGYGVAAKSDKEAVFWMQMAIEESRRTGAVAIQIGSGSTVIAHLLAEGNFEDAVEMGVFVGRGLVVDHARGPRTRQNFEGVGLYIDGEYRKLSEADRHKGDQFVLITGIIPTAMMIVRLSLTDTKAAVAAGCRVAAMCRELATDASGDQELWQTAVELLELSSRENTNIAGTVGCIAKIEGDSEREIALRILGYILCSWYARPNDVIGIHLGMSETLLRWFPLGDEIYRLVVMPYFESYWRSTAEHRRFSLRGPDAVQAALDVASQTPERARVCAVLLAAALGFRIQDANHVLQRLRQIMDSQVHS